MRIQVKPLRLSDAGRVPARQLEGARGHLHYSGRGGHLRVRRRLLAAGAALVAVCVLGTAGYWFIGGGDWSLEDCAYMVLITITSVGYGEVLPVASTDGGRAFTMVLLGVGMGVSIYFLSALTAFVVEGDLREALWRRKMKKRVDRKSGHYVLCGAGSTGAHVADELIGSGCDLVIVEQDPARFARLTKAFGERFIGIAGDATDEDLLAEAGVSRARGLVTTLPLDQDNLFVALSARGLNPRLRIVSRAHAERAGSKLRQAGADAVVNATHIGGRRMAQELLRPSAVGFLDLMSREMQRNLDIEQVEVVSQSPLVGRTLAKSRIREVSSALVLAVVEDGKHTYNPGPETSLKEGNILIVLGESEQIERLQGYVSGARGSRG